MEKFGPMLIENRSKQTCLSIASFIGHDPERFQDLVDEFFESPPREQDLIMWAMNHTVDQAPELIFPHLERFVHHLQPSNRDPVKRGIIRILRDVDKLPEDIMGEVYTKIFEMVQNPAEPIAVRAFGMYVLTNIARELPELKEELIPLFQDIYTYTEKGVQNVARNALKKLSKLP
jgi:hypothetical protein